MTGTPKSSRQPLVSFLLFGLVIALGIVVLLPWKWNRQDVSKPQLPASQIALQSSATAGDYHIDLLPQETKRGDRAQQSRNTKKPAPGARPGRASGESGGRVEHPTRPRDSGPRRQQEIQEAPSEWSQSQRTAPSSRVQSHESKARNLPRQRWNPARLFADEKEERQYNESLRGLRLQDELTFATSLVRLDRQGDLLRLSGFVTNLSKRTANHVFIDVKLLDGQGNEVGFKRVWLKELRLYPGQPARFAVEMFDPRTEELYYELEVGVGG